MKEIEPNEFEKYSGYVDAIIKKAKVEYERNNRKHEFVYRTPYCSGDLQLVHYFVDGFHVYCYDEIYSYISKDELFDN